jgi:hypothetical protein
VRRGLACVDCRGARALQVARDPARDRVARRSAIRLGDTGDFRFASELVAFIRRETGDHFHIDVAAYPECHPQAAVPQDDLDAFKLKIDAGANSAITQYFYNADAYWHFVDSCRAAGIAVPIVPGIMPISSFVKLARFSDACGAEIPRWIRRQLRRLRRRRRVDPRVRPRRGHRARRRASGPRRAGIALLHAESGVADATIWQRLGL